MALDASPGPEEGPKNENLQACYWRDLPSCRFGVDAQSAVLRPSAPRLHGTASRNAGASGILPHHSTLLGLARHIDLRPAGERSAEKATPGINVIVLPSYQVVTPFKILGANYGASFTELDHYCGLLGGRCRNHEQ